MYAKRFLSIAALAVAVAAAVGSAAPPPLEIPAEVKPTGQYARMSPKTTAVAVVYVGLDGLEPIPPEVLKDPNLFLLDTYGKPAGRYRFAAVGASNTGEQSRADFVLVIGDAPPGPGPAPGPGPNPPPGPVTSFRVVLVYESGDSLTPAQRGVVYGKAVEDWLTASCTGGKAGWRRRDKDAPGEADPTMAALWAAVKPALTVTPAVAVERNGKVDIIPLEATPEAMVAKLKTYRGP